MQKFSGFSARMLETYIRFYVEDAIFYYEGGAYSWARECIAAARECRAELRRRS